MQSLIEAIHAVELVKAIKRIPDELRGHSFFSQFDLWQYEVITDDKTCSPCLDLDTRFYYGDELRGEFFFMQVIDANTIEAHIHPNCRCVLNRITEPDIYLSVTRKKLETQE